MRNNRWYCIRFSFAQITVVDFVAIAPPNFITFQSKSTDWLQLAQQQSLRITQVHQISPSVWNLVRDQGVGGSNPLSPTNYFQLLRAAARPQKPTPWFCTRFHRPLKRSDPHKYRTSALVQRAAPSTKSTTVV